MSPRKARSSDRRRYPSVSSQAGQNGQRLFAGRYLIAPGRFAEQLPEKRRSGHAARSQLVQAGKLVAAQGDLQLVLPHRYRPPARSQVGRRAWAFCRGLTRRKHGMATSEQRGGIGGISLGGVLVIVGIVVAIFWSF